jgi:hypothetical protein
MSNRRVLIQFGDRDSLPLLALTKARHEQWAHRMGYEYIIESKRETIWYPHFERYVMACKVWEQNPDALVFYMDSDSVIVGDYDPEVLLPDTKAISLLWDNDVSYWRSGVMVVRGCPDVRRCFENVAKDGPPVAARPWDDEATLNTQMKKDGIIPYPLDARYNRIVRYTPANIPADEPEVRVAAMHGMPQPIRQAFVGRWARDWEKYNPRAGDDKGTPQVDITWMMRAHTDYSRCERAIDQLRRVYPSSDVMIIDDGTFNSEYDLLGAKHRCRVYHLSKMYELKTAGKMWQRDLMTYVNDAPATSRWLVKVDTDTMVVHPMWRAFKPGVLFGSVMERKHQKFVQGGFIGMDRASAGKIVDSGIMTTDAFNNERWLLPNTPNGQMCEDVAISFGARDIGIKCVSHAEVGSAVLHPAKW